RVLLGHAVHLDDGGIDLLDAGALFLAGGSDLGHDRGDLVDAAHDLHHGGAGARHLLRALLDLADRVVGQPLDFLGRGRRAVGQGTHFTGDDREAAALFTGAGGFDRRVQGQDIGLEGDAVDDADDVDDALRG